jgi:hypothetical protein
MPNFKEIIILDIENLGTKSIFYGALILFYTMFYFLFHSEK